LRTNIEAVSVAPSGAIEQRLVAVFLEKRVEADSGEVAFSIFRRKDNSYQFRTDRLRPADDEYLAYWVEGYPLSGLYRTAAEAETAARNSPEWYLRLNKLNDCSRRS
jgi:hypothetical protein